MKPFTGWTLIRLLWALLKATIGAILREIAEAIERIPHWWVNLP